MARSKSNEERRAITAASGVMSAFWTALLKAVREQGGAEEDVYVLGTDEGASLVSQLANGLVQLGQAVRDIFVLITAGRKKTSEVVAAGRYDYANPAINDQNFPWRPFCQRTRQVQLVDMRKHGFPSSYSFEDACAVLAKPEVDLNRPQYEDALFFGEQFPEKYRERPIMFPHEPWLDPDRDRRRVAVLYGGAVCRGLDLLCADDGWDSCCLVAGVRK